jgi:hypothetical protein
MPAWPASWRDNSEDSFMTAGTYGGSAYGGTYFASTNTQPDANFTGTSWIPAPGSPVASTIPQGAGWYASDPFSADTAPEATSLLEQRCDPVLVAGQGSTSSQGAPLGIWCAHLVVAASGKRIGVDCMWRASAIVRTAGGTQYGTFEIPNPPIPAPGAISLLCIAAFGPGSRQRTPGENALLKK